MTLITTPKQIPQRSDTDGLLRVPVPEWGDDAHVLIGRLSGLQYGEYIEYMQKDSAFGVPKSRHAALVATCLRDENGKPTSSAAQSEPLARQTDAAVLLRLFLICEWHNKIDGESYEELKKNYAATHSNGSATASPAT